MKDIKIIVATHKKFWMPKDEIYLPLHVGKERKADIGYIGDNTGENISVKNPYYCELTGLYWAWKNLNCEYLGLVHYRRHFAEKSPVFTAGEIERKVPDYGYFAGLLKKSDLIVPKKRRYYIESLSSHYAHTHYAEHLELTRKVIQETCPDYLADFDRVMKQRGGYMFNMFVMRKDLSDQYCEWLFPILEQLEGLVCTDGYSAFQKRFYGRISELLFNVWLRHMKIKFTEIPFQYMEKIDWKKKGTAFLRAKYMGKRFEGSF